MMNTKTEKKLILQNCDLTVFIDIMQGYKLASFISFCFEGPDEYTFEKYKRLLSKWVKGVNKNLSKQIYVGGGTYEISFNFSSILGNNCSYENIDYDEIEDWISELFSIINSISEIEEPSEFIDRFTDSFLSEKRLFIDNMDWIRSGGLNVDRRYKVGTRLYEIFKSSSRILFDKSDMSLDDITLYLEGKYEL